uniref:ATP synthase complex subunit 8 n=1 Tax=Brachygluta helferi TaxID=351497 RepID=A0A0S2M6U8_9COLE|nr:ATP synthase F0 subunit 8 [Brachygluta helferi]
MPQMAPMNWIFLYFMFSMSFIIFNIMNYYFLCYKMNIKNNINPHYMMKNWNW